MGGLYKQKANGRDYVDKTEKMTAYTIFLMLNMPAEWKELLTIPLGTVAQEIETCVEKANAVYIPRIEKDGPAFIRALTERRELLYEALRMFRDFDCKLDRLLRQIDLMQSEKKRLKNIMQGLIEDARKSDEEIPEIRLIARMGDVEYRSANGSKVYKLKLTSKQKDHLLKLTSEARESIRKRVERDNYYIESASQSVNNGQ